MTDAPASSASPASSGPVPVALACRHASGRTPILVGSGLLESVAAHVPAVAAAGRAFVIADAAVENTHAAAVVAGLEAAGITTATATVTATETEKSPATITRLHEAMAAARVERRTPVIAVGGGITGDVAGFAAATWLRGVPVVQVPTTLLAMVDASIGGKTGVNLRLASGDLGKNLVGAFWAPAAVLSDPRTLATLPGRERRCGLAECLKHAMIAGGDLAERIDRDREAIGAADPVAITGLVAAAAAIKIAVVEEDERESGRREQLNLGHTFGHAIEAVVGARWHHGEAVAIGLVAAARVGVRLGRLAAADAETAIARIEAAGLPVRLEAPVPVARLEAAMAHDKKVSAGRLRLVIPGPLGTCAVLDDVPAADVRAAWLAVGAVDADLDADGAA